MENIELETPSKILANTFAKLSVNDDAIIGDENVRNGNENNYGGEYRDSHSNATQVHDTRTHNKFKTTIEVSNCFMTFQKESQQMTENLQNDDSINVSMRSVEEYNNSHLEVENSEQNHKIRNDNGNDEVDDNFKQGREFMGELDNLEMTAFKRETSNSSLSRMSLYRQFDPLVDVQSSLINSDKTIKVTNMELEMSQKNTVPENDSFDDSIDAETSMNQTTLMKFSTPMVPKINKMHFNSISPDECLNVPQTDKFINDTKSNNQMIAALKEQELLFQQQLLEKDKMICQLKKDIETRKLQNNESLNYQQLTNALLLVNKELADNANRLVNDFNTEKDELIEKNNILTQEKEQALQDATSVEKSFYEIHSRYTKIRTALESCKLSEENYKELYAEALEKIKEKDLDYDALKAKAEEKLEDYNMIMENERRSGETEAMAIRTQLKKAEMTINSLNAQMEQKTHENLELTKMLDELIAKVGK